MSLIPLFMPIVKPVSQIIEDARHKARVQNKQLAAEMGVSPADLSKSIAGKRSFDLFRVVKANEDFQRELYTELLAALDQRVERDLVAALIGRVDELLAVVGRRQVKAELRDVDEQQKRSA